MHLKVTRTTVSTDTCCGELYLFHISISQVTTNGITGIIALDTMAEVFPEELQGNHKEDFRLKSESNSIEILLLATKWQFDTYGLSTVNKCLVNNLRVIDPEGKKIKITCAVVEEEHITEDERKDAEKYKVKLKGAKQPRGRKKRPSIEWLDEFTGAYYLDLVREQNYDFIIGHVPYLANGSLNLRDLSPSTPGKPKVILFVHGFPKTKEGDDIDEDVLLEWLTEVDVVFSVGKAVEAELLPYIGSLPPEDRPIHKLYVPSFPLELFNVQRDIPKESKSLVNKNVMLMTGERKDTDVNGIDFTLAVNATVAASKHILSFDGLKTNFIVLTNNKEDAEAWKKEFTELIEKQKIKCGALHFQSDAPETLNKLKIHLRRSNLFLFPLKSNSPLFGTEALAAIAAGVPVLVSEHSGIASVLEILAQSDCMVQEPGLIADPNTWKEAIIQKLVKPEESQRAANILREQLLLDTTIAQSHLDFIKTITGKMES